MEILSEKEENLDYFKPFGCLVHVKIKKKKTSKKLKTRSEKCILLASFPHGNYRVIGLNDSRVFISRDVIFKEHVFPAKQSPKFLDCGGEVSEKKQTSITYLSDSSEDLSLSSSSSSSSHSSSSSSDSQDSVPDPEPVQVASDEDYDPIVTEKESPPDSGDDDPARSSVYNLRSKKKTVSFFQKKTIKET